MRYQLGGFCSTKLKLSTFSTLHPLITKKNRTDLQEFSILCLLNMKNPRRNNLRSNLRKDRKDSPLQLKESSHLLKEKSLLKGQLRRQHLNNLAWTWEVLGKSLDNLKRTNLLKMFLTN